MRLILLALLPLALAAQDIDALTTRELPAEDQPQMLVLRPRSVLEALRERRADARDNDALNGPGRLILETDDPRERVAALGKHVTYMDFRTGLWKPTAPALYTTERGWVMTGGPVDTVVYPRLLRTLVGLRYTDPDRGDEYFWYVLAFPRFTHMGGLDFSYQHDGLSWTFSLSADGTGFGMASAPISTRGSRTFTFPFRSSHPVTVDASGSLRNTDGPFLLTRAVMVGADGHRYPCSAWAAAESIAGFTCDDAVLPQEAFPYRIDPTSSLSEKQGRSWGLSWTSDGYGNWVREHDEQITAVFDTGSLRIDTISSASLASSSWQFQDAYGGGQAYMLLFWSFNPYTPAWSSSTKAATISYYGLPELINFEGINKAGDTTLILVSGDDSGPGYYYNVTWAPVLELTYTVRPSRPRLIISTVQ